MNRSIIAVICSFLLISATSALDVAKLLSQNPEYTTFSDLLTKTGLATEINSKATITILAIPNGAIGDLTSKPVDLAKKILATHIVLDYFDVPKLNALSDKTAKLTTMFQQSGKAVNEQGFLNVAAKDGSFVFGSAVKGAQLTSKLEKSVVSQPYNVSILGVSQAIVIPGIDAPAPNSAPAPSPANNASAPVPTLANAPVPTPAAASPKADGPAASPKAASPSDSPAPSSDDSSKTPAKSPDSPPADSAHAPAPSSAGKLKVSFGLFIVLASMVAAY